MRTRTRLPLLLASAVALCAACDAEDPGAARRSSAARSREDVTAPMQRAVCVNGPAVYGGALDEAAVDAVIALAPDCARVNVREIVDPSNPARLVPGVVALYDHLLARYADAGISPYLLLHVEMVPGFGETALRDDDNLLVFSLGAEAVVEHFRDRARYYEVVNEPNNWVGPSDPKYSPAQFAHVLSEVYDRVRNGHPDWPVEIVSGALLTHPTDDGVAYLRGAYRAWGCGGRRYPFDQLGMHFYIDGGDTGAAQSEIRRRLGVWARAMAGCGDTGKRVFVSEFGWEGDDTPAGDGNQADLLAAAFDVLRDDGRVGAGIWFNLNDFDEIDGEGRAHRVRWGLYRLGGYADEYARPSRDRFRAITAASSGGSTGGGGGGGGSSGGGSGGASASTAQLDVHYPVGEGAWITQCAPDGSAQYVWQTTGNGRDDSSRWSDFRYPQSVTGSCGDANGGLYPLVFTSFPAGELGGVWVVQCTGRDHAQHVYRMDSAVDGHPAAVYLYDEPNASCP